MRTTITLEPDVEALLHSAMKERGLSFKETLNSAVRAGLTAPKARRGVFIQKTYPMGAEQSFRWDKALAMASAMEDEEFARKLALGK